MAAISASTALILAASLILGRAILGLLGWPRPAWLSGATGFAALVVVAPLLVRLPGRAVTAAVLIGVLCALAAVRVAREPRDGADPLGWPVGVAVVAITVALATLPFVLNERIGVLGEGIYTNDHAAQLYWADWLQNAFGPEPSAVRFGYPTGPQAVAVIAAEITGSSLVSSFNGLLLAIPALTGLTALGALRELPAGRRIAVAAICGLPYLAASFLAQSAFKETAMALFVLAFAIAIAALSGREVDSASYRDTIHRSAGRGAVGAARAVAPPPRAVLGVGLILAAAGVFTFSLPGLAWFAIGVPIWLLLEAIAGRSPIDYGRIGESLSAHRALTAVTVVALIAVAVVAIGPATNFIEKIDDVQSSAGRLSSPVFPGEALGIWPEGDFRIVRGEVSGSLLAAGLAALAAGYGIWVLIRRRQLALLAMLVTGGIVYLGARRFAEIHVEAKALAVIAPLVLLVGLRALLVPGERGGATLARYALGALVLAGAVGSTVLALRSAPVGFDDRAAGLERLAERIQGDPVAFLGVDRFAGYRLRGTLARAPAGYVPEEIKPRPEKTWQQGEAADFDSLDSGQLDKFAWAITTTAAYASAAPKNFAPVVESGDYVLWRRRGETPRSRVLDERGAPGAEECLDPADREAVASVFDTNPVVANPDGWKGPEPVETAAAGQQTAFLAPATATATLELPKPGEYELSLQYHSQAALEVLVGGEVVAELPPSLDGMYIDGAGQGAFWPAGEFAAERGGGIEVEVRAKAPSGLQDAVGVERRVWLGELAATATADPVTKRLAGACDDYIDHFRFTRSGGGR